MATAELCDEPCEGLAPSTELREGLCEELRKELSTYIRRDVTGPEMYSMLKLQGTNESLGCLIAAGSKLIAQFIVRRRWESITYLLSNLCAPCLERGCIATDTCENCRHPVDRFLVMAAKRNHGLAHRLLDTVIHDFDSTLWNIIVLHQYCCANGVVIRGKMVHRYGTEKPVPDDLLPYCGDWIVSYSLSEVIYTRRRPRRVPPGQGAPDKRGCKGIQDPPPGKSQFGGQQHPDVRALRTISKNDYVTMQGIRKFLVSIGMYRCDVCSATRKCRRCKFPFLRFLVMTVNTENKNALALINMMCRQFRLGTYKDPIYRVPSVHLSMLINRHKDYKDREFTVNDVVVEFGLGKIREHFCSLYY